MAHQAFDSKESISFLAAYMSSPYSVYSPTTNYSFSKFQKGARLGAATNVNGKYWRYAYDGDDEYSNLYKLYTDGDTYYTGSIKKLERSDYIFLKYAYCGDSTQFNNTVLKNEIQSFLEWSKISSVSSISSKFLSNSADMNPFSAFDIIKTSRVISSEIPTVSNMKKSYISTICIDNSKQYTTCEFAPKVTFSYSNVTVGESYTTYYESFNGISRVLMHSDNVNMFKFSKINIISLMTYSTLETLTSYVYTMYNAGGCYAFKTT